MISLSSTYQNTPRPSGHKKLRWDQRLQIVIFPVQLPMSRIANHIRSMHTLLHSLSDDFTYNIPGILCMYGIIVISSHIARVKINRLRLPILLVVSCTGKMNISPSFVPENLVSRNGFDSPVSRQPAHLHTYLPPIACVSTVSTFCITDAPFIPVVGVRKRGAHLLVHGDMQNKHPLLELP